MVSRGARDEGREEGRVEAAGPQGLGWMLRTQEASTKCWQHWSPLGPRHWEAMNKPPASQSQRQAPSCTGRTGEGNEALPLGAGIPSTAVTSLRHAGFLSAGQEGGSPSPPSSLPCVQELDELVFPQKPLWCGPA